jgi:hypothetical protein
MKLSNLNEYEKKVLNELEKEVGFPLKKDMEDNKFMLMNWKWVVKFNDFDLYNKFAEKFNGEKAKGKYQKKSFSYVLPNRGPYS